MKNCCIPALFIVLLLSSCKTRAITQSVKTAGAIDSIQTARQIEDLVARVNERYKNFKVNDPLTFSDKRDQRVSDSLHVKPFVKADFDGNGRTDLLAIGNWYGHAVLCIFDKGKGRYEINRVTRSSFQGSTFPVVDHNNIRNYSFVTNEFGESPRLRMTTLTYRFGDFIEENPNPVRRRIDRIEYSTTPCYGTCPVFKLTLYADGSAEWKADLYNKIGDREFSGDYTAQISPEKLAEIQDMLNYIDFERLLNSYSVNWTDDQSCTLKISYDDGKIKSIRDYGKIGTYGLQRVYAELFKLRETEKWKQ